MRPLDLHGLGLHLARLALFSAALLLAPTTALRVLAATAVFFTAFSLAHDLAHGALALPRRANEFALAASGLFMLTSGHALRLMHLRHHARPLADDDLEGLGGRLSLGRALLLGPRNAIDLRIAAFRAARGSRARAWQVGEMIGAVVLVLLLDRIDPAAARVYLLTASMLQATTSVWASHIPHRGPLWIRRLAARAAFLRSPVLLALAFHDLHHRAPKVPCHQLK